MHTWKVYLERADTDEPPQLIGTIDADTMAQALDRAAQLYEYPQHDLVVKPAVKATYYVRTTEQAQEQLTATVKRLFPASEPTITQRATDTNNIRLIAIPRGIV